MKCEVYIPDPVYKRISESWEALGFSDVREALDWTFDAGADRFMALLAEAKGRAQACRN